MDAELCRLGAWIDEGKFGSPIRLRKIIIYMSILLLTKRANWQQISAVVMRIAGQCKDAPHYLWVEKPRLPVFAVELETLLRNLDLEDQWAYIETDAEKPDDVSRIVDASDANWSKANPQ